MRQTIRNKQYAIYIMIVSILFLLFYSANTSPLYPNFYGWDSAFFTLAGQMVRDGRILYVDIMDSKGPILYWLYAVGESFLGGREGIWYLQVIFLFISLYYAFLTIRLFVNGDKQAFSILGLGMLVWMGTFENGGLTEELSLPFLIAGSYYLIKYVKEKREQHPPIYAVWYGICFACMVFIRITNAAMLCGLVAAVVLLLIIRKKWGNLFQNGACFLMGFAIVTVPIGLYFYSNGAMDDFIMGVFQLAGNYADYGRAGLNISALLVWFGKNSLLLFSMCIAFRYARKKNAQCGYAVLFAQTVLLFVLLLGNGYLHYFTLVVPAFLVGAGMLYELSDGWGIQKLRRQFKNAKVFSSVAAILFLTAVLYFGIYSVLTTGGNMLKAATKYYEAAYNAIRQQTELIPPEERDSVLAYNIRPRWYVIGNLQPCYRLGAYQENFTRLMPQLQREQEENLRNNPPLWAAVELEYLDCPQLEEMLQADYRMVNESEGISLYRRK